MFDGGFMNQPFAFGGEEGKEAFDEQIIYRSSLQNFLIDTGKEVILVDTGFKTVYLSTHCPEGYENLEMKRVMNL